MTSVTDDDPLLSLRRVRLSRTAVLISRFSLTLFFFVAMRHYGPQNANNNHQNACQQIGFFRGVEFCQCNRSTENNGENDAEVSRSRARSRLGVDFLIFLEE